MTVLAASRIQLTSKHVGMGRIDGNPPGCVELINTLLQKNHDQFDMFWRPAAGHNHTVHSVLSVYALGGGLEDLQRAYDDDDLHQEPMSKVSNDIVDELKNPERFLVHMRQLHHYGNFLRFFEQEIEAKGWQEVIHEYCFSDTPVAKAMFHQLFDGAYHPIIHLGFGIEFEQPSIVAEGLAHTATHDPANIDVFFERSDEAAKSGKVPTKPLQELYHEVRNNEKIRTAAKMQQGPVRIRDGVMAVAREEIAAVAAQFQVSPDDLDRGLLEMISCAAYSAGASQRKGKEAKIDFFLMHTVTSSIFVTLLVRQPWISAQTKANLIEWKARIDLVWYASCAAPELDLHALTGYRPTSSKGMDWSSLYKATIKVHDDGHVSKFVRALKCSEELEKSIAHGKRPGFLPVHGDLWFRLAQMGYDTTVGLPDSKKWIMGAGFDPLWAGIPDAPATT